MPLQKIVLKPGVNRENTRYTNEGGWYESDKVRFRQGTPEKIGGWSRISGTTFIGICRSLWNWVTNSGENLIGVGTTEKFYVEYSGEYYDITPVRATALLGTDPFTTTSGSNIVTVSAFVHGAATDDYVTFYGATDVGGLTLNGEYKLTRTSSSIYTINAGTPATSSATGGGSAVYAAYQVGIGNSVVVEPEVWGGSTWGESTWGGVGAPAVTTIRLWTQYNFGQSLIFGPKLGAMYYWEGEFSITQPIVTISVGTPAVITFPIEVANGTAIALETTGNLPTGLAPATIYYVVNASGVTANLALTAGGAAINTTGTQSGVQRVSRRGIAVSKLSGASDVPALQNTLFVSDASRFTMVFGSTDYLSPKYDPMLVRWTDQESITNWTPAITNQAGSIRLSHGSVIVGALQARQEILIWTDAALYSLQYLGPPYVWGSQILSDNISVASLNAMAYASGVAYWMGTDKFYKYDGRVNTLQCDLWQHIYADINKSQNGQIFAGTNEGFNEVWWFYCSADSLTIDRYAIYNYGENIWYYGTMARTAWLDTSLRPYPLAATYANNLVNHEFGVDDNITGTPVAIESSITSSQFDIGDGHNFAFVWRMLPDLTFRGSTAGTTPSMTIQLLPLQNSGSGYNNPISIGGTSATGAQTVTATQTYPIDLDTYNGQLNIRVRGRQMSMKITSNTLGTQWQLGAPRIDTRPDGRR